MLVTFVYLINAGIEDHMLADTQNLPEDLDGTLFLGLVLRFFCTACLGRVHYPCCLSVTFEPGSVEGCCGSHGVLLLQQSAASVSGHTCATQHCTSTC